MNRRGFTLLELLIVLGIAILMVAMSVPSVLSAIRRARVDEGAQSIIDVSVEAQILARRYGGSGRIYGIQVIDDPSDPPARAEIVTHSGGSTHILANSSGDPILRKLIPDSAILMNGNTDLQGVSGQTLTWWYQPGTGRLTRTPGSTTEIGGVGLPSISLTNAVGKSVNTISASTNIWTAQGGIDEGAPGLWLRDPNGSYAIALRVYPSGIVIRERLETIP